MTQKTFNIYCDESTHLPNDHHPYMVLGYVSISSNQIKMAKEQIKDIKEKYNYERELKWTDVRDSTSSMYNEIIDYFFMTDMKFRAVIIDKSQIDESRPEYTFNDFYFRMYFQLLHHLTNMEDCHNVYFDIKDTRSQKKLAKLREILRWNSSVKNFQFIRSHESIFMQLADILMGAINYNLRIEANEIEGKVIAKLKLVQKIQSHTNISLDRSTPLSQKKFNLFFIDLKK